MIGLFTVAFGNALGAWWEIVEFCVDKGLGKNTQYGLDNTMHDLVNNLLGSLLAAALGWLYVRFTRPSERRRLAEPLGRLVGPVLLGAEPESSNDPVNGPGPVLRQGASAR